MDPREQWEQEIRERQQNVLIEHRIRNFWLIFSTIKPFIRGPRQLLTAVLGFVLMLAGMAVAVLSFMRHPDFVPLLSGIPPWVAGAGGVVVFVLAFLTVMRSFDVK